MSLEKLRNDIIIKQKKGMPFIIASVVIWLLITIVASIDISIGLKNIFVFCCSVPLLPLSWMIGKKIGVNIFSKENELGNLGFLFTMNQILYLLIVMWVFNVVPNKMIMVYAMVFGAHLLPYSWLYKSKAYKIFSIIIPICALVLGNLFSGFVVAGALTITEFIFVIVLQKEFEKFTI
ncbi:DUF7010 family protein [Sharpea azabuensis]|uniref:Uncharacterized protein n=1 Tax=Sharpea azabuensis TaxID=322505 RepID=A0A1H6Y434_9FIRM|nr:hypothetical protein [Sharpea azabuensis]SEJ36063.1 hypothetical protein SAMN04487834_11242 [Sharpea azabuensis]